MPLLAGRDSSGGQRANNREDPTSPCVPGTVIRRWPGTSRDACGWPDWSASCSPPPILVVLALVVAWDSSPTLGMAVLWGGIAALFASVLPYALILRGVRQGRLTDKNISLREQRIRFGVVAITSILLGLAVLAVFGAPAEMVALVASIAVGVACGWVITLWWKISVHAAIAAGAATVLLLVFGPAAGRLAPGGRDRLVPGPGG